MKLHSNRRSYDKRRSRPQNAENKNPKVMAGSLAAIVISAVILCMVVVIGIVGFVGHGSVTTTTAPAPAAGTPVHCWYFVDGNEVATDTETFSMEGSCFQKDGISYLPADGIATGLGGSVRYDEEKDEWVDGTIYDPVHGKTYKSKMWFGGEKILKIRGYIGIPAFGRTMTWTKE